MSRLTVACVTLKPRSPSSSTNSSWLDTGARATSSRMARWRSRLASRVVRPSVMARVYSLLRLLCSLVAADEHESRCRIGGLHGHAGGGTLRGDAAARYSHGDARGPDRIGRGLANRRAPLRDIHQARIPGPRPRKGRGFVVFRLETQRHTEQ